MTRRTILLAALLTAGCDSLQGPGYRGEALATLRGELTAATTLTSADRPDHLALGWMNWSRRTDGDWAVTQEVDFKGDVPLEYRFDVFEPPPEDALQSCGPDCRFTVGALIAYRDQNGNGKLDTIPRGGSPVDLLLAASTSLNLNDGEDYYELLYLEGTPVSGFRDVKPGFNLIRNGKVVPLDTPIPLAIGRAARHNLLLCNGVNEGISLEDWNRCLGGDEPRLFGTVQTGPEGPSAWIGVYDGSGAVTDATVTVNGTALTAFGDGYGFAPGSADPLRAGAYNTVRAQLASGAALELAVWMDAAPVIVQPAPDASLDKDDAITVTWNPVEGATLYGIGLHAFLAGRSRSRYAYTPESSRTLPPWTALAELTAPLQGSVSVFTYRISAPLSGSDLSAMNSSAVPVTFTP